MADKKYKNEAEKLREERLDEIKSSTSELESYKTGKLKLQCPTFFVPGWTGENCSAWKKQYSGIPLKFKEFFLPIKYWLENIIENPEYAEFIDFVDETKDILSFIGFGKVLKEKIERKLKALSAERCSPVNLAGHSMGGLDSRAAVLDKKDPLLNVRNLITVGTPNNGNKFVRLVANKYPRHHKEQCLSMHPNSDAMKLINKPESKITLLNSIEKFYIFMGLKDMVAGKSPKLSKEGIPAELYEEKVKIIQATSDEHTDKDGITQDPRMILSIIKVLCGIKLRSSGNKGYFFKRT